ncbi:MAG TPA: hypothetical protein V6C81_22810 [Planktothrix sp.]|jgi:hypothetical protein
MKYRTKLLSIAAALSVSLTFAVASFAATADGVGTQPSSGEPPMDVDATLPVVPSSHVEMVPIDESHSDATPEMKVMAGDKVKLTGEVERDQALINMNSKLGFSVLPDGKDPLSGKVIGLQPDSPLIKRGVVNGDKLISELKNNDGTITLTMEHAGQAFRFNLTANELKAAIAKEDTPKPTQLQAGTRQLEAGTTDTKKPNPVKANVDSRQFKSMVDVMANHDLGLVIDRSGSMSTRDCPGGMTRWQWCCVEATELARAAAQASSSIDAAIFNSEYMTYKHISPQQIPEIFATNMPAGGTEPAYALKEQMENYFNGSRAKPLTIVMVTDGMPNSPKNIAAMLQEESSKIRYQGEVTVTVLLISDEVGDARFRDTCGLTPDSSVREGGFVDIIPFGVLEQKGVGRALFDDLKEVRVNTDPRKASRARMTALGPSYLRNGAATGWGIRNYGGLHMMPGIVNYPR